MHLSLQIASHSAGSRHNVPLRMSGQMPMLLASNSPNSTSTWLVEMPKLGCSTSHKPQDLLCKKCCSRALCRHFILVTNGVRGVLRKYWRYMSVSELHESSTTKFDRDCPELKSCTKLKSIPYNMDPCTRHFFVHVNCSCGVKPTSR